MTESPIDVLVIGRSCRDTIAVVDRFPPENTKVPLSSKMVEGGGQGSTAACCIARLGGRVAYIGVLGDDPAGEFCRRRLEDFGVQTDFVRTVPGGRTPEAFVIITRPSGNRTIVYEKNELPRLTADDIPASLPQRAKTVLLDPETTYLARFFRDLADPPTMVYDAERWRPGIEEMMAVADHFIPTADLLDAPELGALLNISSSDFVDRLIALDRAVAGQLVVTRGEEGAYFVEAGRVFQVRPPEVTIRDTVGAGDNFHAAYALGISRGMALSDAVRFAVAVATLSCRDYGGRNGIPGWEEAIDHAEALTIGQID